MSLVLAAKISHVPSLYVGEQPGPAFGVRESIRQGLKALGKRARLELGVETFVVLDVHWINTIGFHLNANPHHQGIYTSHELPHFIHDLEYDLPGDPEIADLIAEEANRDNLKTRAHRIKTLGLEYATILPMRYMNPENAVRVVSIGQNINTTLDENRRFGEAIRRAVERTNRKIGLLASGSLSHAFWTNELGPQGLTSVSSPFNEQTDHYVLGLWKNGRIKEFLEFLPTYARVCTGEVNMSDTIQLFGALGWSEYQGKGTQYGNYEGSSGTGQAVVEFPVDNLPPPVPPRYEVARQEA
jgi:3,4-dihydroxyphenylacetate 2,3-dioxygenase